MNQSLDLYGVSARSCKQCAKATNDGPTMYFQQARKRCSNFTHTRKKVRRDEPPAQPAAGNCLRSREVSFLEMRKLECAMCRSPIHGTWRSHQEYQEQVNLAEDAPPLGIQAQSQHFDLENVYVGVDEGSDACGTRIFFKN